MQYFIQLVLLSCLYYWHLFRFTYIFPCDILNEIFINCSSTSSAADMYYELVLLFHSM